MNNMKCFSIVGTLFIILFGVIFHFIYEWSDNNTLVGIFGAVNESVWEHLKLLFWPALIFSIFEYILIGKYYNNYFLAKAVSFYIGILLIIIIFYTYTGIIGKNILIVDISSFIISVIASQYIGYKIMNSSTLLCNICNKIGIVAILLLIIAFTAFTFQPPKIALFKDPITESYGINNSK